MTPGGPPAGPGRAHAENAFTVDLEEWFHVSTNDYAYHLVETFTINREARVSGRAKDTFRLFQSCR